MSVYDSIESMWQSLEKELVGRHGNKPETIAIRKAFFMLGANAYSVVQRKIALDNRDATPEQGMALLKAFHENVERQTDVALEALRAYEGGDDNPSTGD